MRGEKLLTMQQAAQWLREELGLVRHPNTIWGWAYYGRRDCKLEVVSVAGHWHTSAGALRRFIEAGTRQHSAESALNVNELKV